MPIYPLYRLRLVPVPQKTQGLTPQEKLIEFLAGITRTCGGAGVSGIERLQDINYGPHPLRPDSAVAQAWGDVKLTPTTYLVNRRGEIVKRYVGEPDFAELHRLIESLLAQV